ncbi:MAG TPA: HD domain-containing protein, partial [Dehalococcoidia bacterium]|nr:HD domain-containing protein [Dehalococcoidia bacterium]
EGKGVLQPKEHHWDVFRHQVETVAAVEALVERRIPRGLAVPQRTYLKAGAESGPWHPALEGYFQGQIGNLTRKTLLKLTALLHDVAKPATKTFEASGRMRFFGHAEIGAEVAGKILARLRFSNRETEAVTRMVANHLRPGQWSDGSVPTPRAVHRYFRDLGEVAIDNIFLNMADHLAARGPELDPLHWQQHVGVADQVLAQHFQQQERTVSPRLATGNDLMTAFSLKPGPQVGWLLVEIEEAQASGEVATKEEALALAQRCLSRVSP